MTFINGQPIAEQSVATVASLPFDLSNLRKVGNIIQALLESCDFFLLVVKKKNNKQGMGA